ncbi:MAG TPA: hypothetical protein VGZ48_01965 [Candidatus Acidoferrales bacterium]|jgi:hypothetical protein|nr:hypothetical protein [Candidatus Acidoferrales bacterium]
MLDLSPKQIALLERCAAAGFKIVAFPMYASAVGLKKGNCAALLTPSAADRMALLGEPCYLIGGNLAVRVRRNGMDLFVWKKDQLEATADRLAELKQFRRELESLIGSGD